MRIAVAFAALILATPVIAAGTADTAFEALAARYLDEVPALSPVAATTLGDHRFDDKLDDVSAAHRATAAETYRSLLAELRRIDRDALSRANQVDAALLENELESSIFTLEDLRPWAWNPLLYTSLAGGSVYGLLARDFAPLPDRMADVAARLEQLPRMLEQVRATLEPALVPRIHAETAVRQNRGVESIIDEMVVPELDGLDASLRRRLEAAMATARAAVEKQQSWLENDLLPAAAGDFRLGCELFDRKLAYALNTPLTRQQVHDRAEAEFSRVRDEMYRVASDVYRQTYPLTAFPEQPSEAFRQAVVRAALEKAYASTPPADGMVAVANEQLSEATAFVGEKGFVALPSAPVDVIVMPEFQRGIALAYCDAPGPLDRNLRTFYAVSPIPADWTVEQIRSWLREYNTYSMMDLTMHEAMPGHYLQLAHANQYPSVLRAVLSSGTFIEGWAVYAERLMVDQGFGGGDPLQRLIQLKWYLRAVANALLDQGIHCGSMTEDEAMRIMVEGAFQEEREAAGKWVRARVTSAQLSTYFVGYQEHADLRLEAERAWGDGFTLRRYHDAVLGYGSPPIRFVRALLFDLPVPR